MADGRTDLEDPRAVAAAWSRVVEPADAAAGHLVRVLGAADALAWLLDAVPGPDVAERAIRRLHAERPDLPDALAPARLLRAVSRWAPRTRGLDPRRELRALDLLGGTLVLPGDPGWPRALDDLGATGPHCLWVRGDPGLAALAARSVAVVGARACTEYGRHVAAELAHGLAGRGLTVVSGGAYGIDAAAHRAALAAGGPTVAFLAGGVDRLYPAGNADLLRAVIDAGGAVVSEVPPGSVPSRVRFLLRNRLIAAASRATVVVEAAWRSGALSTATRAAELLRPVGAVPGPVTSMASGGCHRLLRDGMAVCVTDADEVAELALPTGEGGAADEAGARRGGDRTGGGRPDGEDLGDLDGVGRRLFDALPVRRAADVTSIARAAGLALDETRGGLGLLELAGFAVQEAGAWRRVPRPAR